jgi:RNA polymerase sigma factor (sigma-70 family)
MSMPPNGPLPAQSPAPPSSVPPPWTSNPDEELLALVRAARAGHEDAWSRLFNRFDRMLRRAARNCGLAPTDVDDAVQAGWISLHRQIHDVREPGALGAWLATVVRRESLRIAQTRVREVLTDDPELGDCPGQEQPDVQLLAAERRATLRRALRALPNRQRQLMTLLASETSPNYEEISATLDMPIGSIGPIRARGLVRLRSDAELLAMLGA